MIGSVVSPLFVGRGAELDTLVDAAARARGGRPVAVLVAGEAGVGKSRLVSEASARFGDDGWRVLTGECFELGSEGLPFAPLVDVLRMLVGTTSPAELDEFLGGARKELAWLLPELAAEAPAGVASQAQLLELVLGVIGRLARAKPLVLVVEDLHWADRSTLELVAFLTRALRDVPVLLVMTYRSDELHRRHPLRPLLTAWDRARSVARIELARLDRDEVAAQLAAILGEPPAPGLVDAVFERSAGNAYFVEEVLGIIQQGRRPGDLPPSLRDVLLTHVEELAEPTQRVVRAASAAGASVPERLLAAVVRLDPASLSTALHEILERHLMVVDDSIPGYAFRHALTRDAVYHDMLPGERVQLHAAYGEALDAEPELAGRAASAMLAHHWYAALDLPRALVAALDAGRQAAARAPADAQQHFERALEVWPRVEDAERLAGADHVDVLQAAATAANHAGAIDRCLQLLDQALAEQPEGRDDARRTLLLVFRARTLRDLGREGEGYRVLVDALALTPEEPPTETRAMLLASLANSTMRLGQTEVAVDWAEQAVRAARAAGAPEQEADANVSLGGGLIYLGQIEPGLEVIRAALAQALAVGSNSIAIRAYVNLSDALEGVCRHQEAADVARTGWELAVEVGRARTTGAFLAGNAAEPLIRIGRWDEAERIASSVLEGDIEGVYAGTVLELLAQIAVLRGEYDTALGHLAEARRVHPGDADLQFSLPLSFIEAEVARAQGDPVGALRVIGATLDQATYWTRYQWPLVWLAMRCAKEQRMQAQDRRERTDGTAQDGSARWTALAAGLATDTAHSRAYSALVVAEREGTTESWSAAVAGCRDAEDPYLVAYALLLSAETQVAGGDRTAATDAARESLAVARQLGAAPLVAAASHLARRARLNLSERGDAPAAPADDPLRRLGLTEREREVMVLIAAGQPNAQIAQTLFISPKTVSVHVSNILTKLDVSGRVEAAAVAHRVGVFGPDATSAASDR